MTIELLGSAGLGLLWGWLLGYLQRPAAHPARSRSFAIASTAAPLVGAWLAVGPRGVPVLLGAMVLSLTTHLAWRRSLLRPSASSQDWRSPGNA